ncbi:hypothetical protein JL721_7204 [Aureococcus anophagefferens]|nr:hypothetical protein JL721_7204 [Aureococcus anophagefferens]
MPEEQCGVPLERRFAFYDMVHTTGMDIRHVANATALVTLGKDMVWRDYAQGVYRMRGVGNGQKVRVVLIPEVRRLLRLELAGCEAAPETGSDLERVVAWLVVNALKSEQLQWSMLCAQNLKNAEDVLDFVGHYADGDAAVDAARAAAGGDAGAGDRLELSYRARRALRVDADADDAETGGDDALAVAPHGADELRAAELKRRRLAIEAAAAERARRRVAAAPGEGLDLVRLDCARVAARPVPELLCACGHALSVYESSWERCGAGRLTTGHDAICWECYVNVCERCVRGHRRAELAKRADTSGRATFARCATGAGVALHVPAKALRFAHPRPLERYTLTLDVRLDRLPAPRAHAALVCLNPAGPRRRASLYVDADGALERPRDVEGDGAAAPPPSAARLRPGKWHAVSLVVDAAAGTLEAFVDGAAGADRRAATPLTRAGRSLHLFAGGARARARRRRAPRRAAVEGARRGGRRGRRRGAPPRTGVLARRRQAVARGFRVRREAEKEDDDDEEEEEEDDDEEEDGRRRARGKKKS